MRREGDSSSILTGSDPTLPVLLDPDVGVGSDFFNDALARQSSAGIDVIDDQTLAGPPSIFMLDDETTAAQSYASETLQRSTSDESHPPSRSRIAGPSRSLSNPSTRSTPSLGVTDSSSSGSLRGHKRKTSDESMRSAAAPDDLLSTDDNGMTDYQKQVTVGDDEASFRYPGPYVNPGSDQVVRSTEFETSNEVMSNDFDFENAASSPSSMYKEPFQNNHIGRLNANVEMPYRIPQHHMQSYPQHRDSNLPHSTVPSLMSLSADASPLSAVGSSHESSPDTYVYDDSPTSMSGFAMTRPDTLVDRPLAPLWPAGQGYSSPVIPPRAEYTPSTSPFNPGFVPPSGLDRSRAFAPGPLAPSPGPQLIIHPTPLKTRVETQIPIRLSLHPMPPGVTKLHLPTKTISKAKLLAKPKPLPSPDMLELHTNLVCTSAMQDPGKLQRALRRAAGPPTLLSREDEARGTSSDDAPMDDDPSNNPLNGADVNICVGCMTRERKRAARKKVKRVEEEEEWQKDEDKRIIVFNCVEIKEWHPPSGDNSPYDDRSVPIIPDGALQVDAPMRIACYCRHQSEKMGFQVIFTIKDYRGNVVAQNMTDSIMITDDHKTHAPPPPPGQAPPPPPRGPPGYDGAPQPPGSGGFGGMPDPPGPGGYADGYAGGYSSGFLGGFSGNPYGNTRTSTSMAVAPFRVSHSSSDLQRLQQQQPPSQYASPYAPSHAPPPNSASGPSVSGTPRNLSRQASPSAAPGRATKKRKSSGAIKVPSGLSMTRLENEGESSFVNNLPANGLTSATPSPRTPSYPPYGMTIDPGSYDPGSYQANVSIRASYPHGLNLPTSGGPDVTAVHADRRTQSLENLPVAQMFSAPASTYQSRAPSPSNNGQDGFSMQQSLLMQALASYNSRHQAQTRLRPDEVNARRAPAISRLIPNDGPRTGGFEVTLLGSHFCPGLEVMFGQTLATTTLWGDTTIICMVPPAAVAGPVAVTFKHEHEQSPTQSHRGPTGSMRPTVWFTYREEDEQELLRLALSVVGNKMHGQMEDVNDLAARIVKGEPGTRGPGGPGGPGVPRGSKGGGQDASETGYQAALGVEDSLLKCLDLIDLDDSGRKPRLNSRIQRSGQTMLHLASARGLHRFVAALLARNVNFEPRDNGGYSPLHLAALSNHPHIVRRLILSGADATLRSLKGYTPADLATSRQVLHLTRSVEHRPRCRPPSEFRRVRSAVTVGSTWPPSYDGGSSDSDSDQAIVLIKRRPYSRRASRVNDATPAVGRNALPAMQAPADDGAVGVTPAVAAFREQLAIQFQLLQQTLQQTMQSNLPSLPHLPNLPQIPALPTMPNLPTYPTYLPNPMARGISSLVPLRTSSRSGAKPRRGVEETSKEGEYRWWELFSGIASAPPAYEEIYPRAEEDQRDRDLKKESAAHAAIDTVADRACGQAYDKTADSSPLMAVDRALHVRLGTRPMSKDDQEQLRTAHAKKMKKIASDRKLFFIWIPLLILVVMAMLMNRVPQVWQEAARVYTYLRNYPGALPRIRL
ncbi:MAG: hypothetical protein M1838_001528 [Thelocarpon superellum]|nr:MAG: hypothetical protein M1838_001528 [Thelocarpon superellum]